uniref:Uncharacterized protein n=1 Tax=Anguilla anguilla TaxID=7936 RepID=A0A0E9P8M9_ANGAN
MSRSSQRTISILNKMVLLICVNLIHFKGGYQLNIMSP